MHTEFFDDTEFFDTIVAEAKKLKILIIGDLLLGHNMIGKHTHLPVSPALTNLEIIRQEYFAGGAGTVARAAKVFTDNIYLVGLLGCTEGGSEIDLAGEQVLKNLRMTSIHNNYICALPEYSTVERRRILAQDGDSLFPVMQLNKDKQSGINEGKLADMVVKQIQRAKNDVGEDGFDVLITVDNQKGMFQTQVCKKIREYLKTEKEKGLFAICKARKCTDTYQQMPFDVYVLNRRGETLWHGGEDLSNLRIAQDYGRQKIMSIHRNAQIILCLDTLGTLVLTRQTDCQKSPDQIMEWKFPPLLSATSSVAEIGFASVLTALYAVFCGVNNRLKKMETFNRELITGALKGARAALKETLTAVPSCEAIRKEYYPDTDRFSSLQHVLENELTDAEVSVRINAAAKLGQIGDPSTVPALIEALSDENASVREKAAFALGNIGDDSALPVLIGILSDEDVSVREGAVFALGEIGGSGAVLGLKKALSDEVVSVRESAVFALGAIGEPEIVSNLAEEFPEIIDMLKRRRTVKSPPKLGKLDKKDVRQAIKTLYDNKH